MTDDDYPTLFIICDHTGTRKAQKAFRRIASVVALPQMGTVKPVEVTYFGTRDPEVATRLNWPLEQIAADPNLLHSTYRFPCERCGADRPVRGEKLYDIVITWHAAGVSQLTLAQLAASLQAKR